MKSTERLKIEIESIGSEVVSCGSSCIGVISDQSSGILPRCLFFEQREGISGAVVVGLNPGCGKDNDPERSFYGQHGATYSAVYEFWSKNVKEVHPYYRRIRSLVDAIGLDGSLWWTELVKCESVPRVKLPIQTLRSCVGRFLNSELQVVPEHWPVLAVGRDAFNALAYMLPRRTVIGFPHPTGSWGAQFQDLFDGSVLCEKVGQLVTECLSEVAAPVPQAIWLASQKMKSHTQQIIPADILRRQKQPAQNAAE